MRIGCLQFAPQVGDVDNNLNRADAVLSRGDPEDLDLLVLPELAFSGYNFKSLQEISPFLEPPGSGISSLWARTSALKHDCTVIVGYPEKVDLADRWPANPEYYNAALVVSSDGETVGNYRKSHLYYTDETWALEGPDGFYHGRLPGLGRTAIGICMDLNPYKFEAPWNSFEFAHHVLEWGVRLVVVSMAWITQEDYSSFSQCPHEPDMHTLMYWVSRLEPVIRADSSNEVIVVFANRTGTEGETTYAGTSAVVGIKSGEVRVYGILGRGEKELLVVDTETAPYAKLVYRPDEESAEVDSQSAPEPSDPERRQSPRGTNSPRQSTEKPPAGPAPNDSKDPTSGLEDRTSSYRRDDLKIQVFQDRRYEKLIESPYIQTPSAPSPTPQSLRPQLKPRPVEPLVKSDLDPYNSSQHRQWGSARSDRTTDEVDEDSSFRRSRAVSPSNSSESHFSDFSGISSQRYRMRSQEPWDRSKEEQWAEEYNDDNGDEIISDRGSVPAEYSNRYSLRSDVSVWNNRPGRPREMGAPLTPPQDLTEQNSTQQPAPLFLEDPSSVAEKTTRSPSRRPGSSRPRTSSQSRDQDQFGFASCNTDMDVIRAKLEGIALRAQSAQARTSNPTEKMDSKDPFTSGAHHGSSATNRLQSAHERAWSNGSIPIAMDPSVWADIIQQGESHAPSQQKPPSDCSVPRSASRIRAADTGTANRGREHKQAPSTNVRTASDGVRSHSSANRGTRDMSRGRKRAASAAVNYPAQTLPSEQRQRGSRSAQNPLPEPVDLSQFRLIEEYPSPNCPIHGSRSHSRAGRRNPSGQRTPASGRRQHPSRQGRESRQSRQNTPSGQPKAKTATRASSKSATNTDAAKASQALQGSSSADMTPSSVATLSPNPEPKTPVAMVLVAEMDGTQQKGRDYFLPTLKCIDRSFEMPIARPRSTVW